MEEEEINQNVARLCCDACFSQFTQLTASLRTVVSTMAIGAIVGVALWIPVPVVGLVGSSLSWLWKDGLQSEGGSSLLFTLV